MSKENAGTFRKGCREIILRIILFSLGFACCYLSGAALLYTLYGKFDLRGA